VLEGLLPAPRHCLLSTSFELPSEPFMQRAFLDWDPPPQVAEQGDQASTCHLNQPEEKFVFYFEIL